MNRTSILISLVCLTTLNCYAQETPIPEGYKLKPSQNVIYAYRNIDDKPDFSVRNRWNHNYWFKVDRTAPGRKFEDSITKEQFLRITIPSASRFDKTKDNWTDETGYDDTTKWKNDEFIDGSDFNTWLWIRKSDFNELAIKYDPGITANFVLSGLTVPFKFRAAAGSQSSSIINGDVNVGSLVGWRFAKGDKYSLSIGGHFGFSSIPLDASNNTNLSGDITETIRGLNYGYGIILDVNKRCQIGLVSGYDCGFGRLAKTYVYQNRSWFSFSLNYKFLDFQKRTIDTNRNVWNKAL